MEKEKKEILCGLMAMMVCKLLIVYGEIFRKKSRWMDALGAIGNIRRWYIDVLHVAQRSEGGIQQVLGQVKNLQQCSARIYKAKVSIEKQLAASQRWLALERQRKGLAMEHVICPICNQGPQQNYTCRSCRTVILMTPPCNFCLRNLVAVLTRGRTVGGGAEWPSFKIFFGTGDVVVPQL
ncbi:hypothetical protein C8R44DRAFT_754666 [Mycena epipterygia]|nr:hypothetical protein C8R44DRAFT_754666 [Mycena epipterygia]